MTENNTALAQELARRAAEQGGRTYYVGGFVRDRLLGRESKDIDVEVHGLTPQQLEAILDSLGQRLTMGESFGIYSLAGHSLDIAMPRKETLRGRGHRDFDVCVDPFAGTQQAARRRDFTVNALMQDVLTGEVVDHFRGQEDLKNGILRHVSDDSFAEDPLRVLRAAQFAARFGFSVAEETVELCRGMDLSALPGERIEQEVRKALLQAEKPSVFFETLRNMHQLDVWFPELRDLIGVKQNPKHHAEGDVWTHTMLVLDVCAAYRDRVQDPFGLMLAAVVHDFGKAVCTETVNGEIHAYGHEILGLPLARAFLQRFVGDKKRMRYVLNLAELHMKPNVLAGDNASVKSSNKMFDSAEDPQALICIALADGLGRSAARAYVSHDDYFSERLEIYRQTMARPYVSGKDLLQAGLAPGQDFSDILAYAHKLRLAGVEKSSALKQTLSYARTLRKKTGAKQPKA